MSIDDETLMAYADGELDADQRAAVERALAEDSALREKLAAHRRLGARLSAAFDGVLDEPTPARLAPPPAQSEAQGTVVRLDQHRARRWSGREWAAMAASAVLGIVVSNSFINVQAPMIAARDGGLIAQGALARALDNQLAGDEAGAVRIGLSFRAHDGRYCRTFDLTGEAVSGLACRAQARWDVAAAAAAESGGEVRMAGASALILSAVDELMADEPLDADAERSARDGGWR